MQNDQVFQDCTLKKYDGGLYPHLSGLPKTYLRQQKIP